MRKTRGKGDQTQMMTSDFTSDVQIDCSNIQPQFAKIYPHPPFIVSRVCFLSVVDALTDDRCGLLSIA